MAASADPMPADAAALQLVREGYAVKHETTPDGKVEVRVSIAVPLFRDWIADWKLPACR
jgi:hypothetical protein